MKILAINSINNRNYVKQSKKNVTEPTFKSAVPTAQYADELLKIDSSVIARTIINKNEELLPVKAVREFIAGFLNGVKNSPNTSEKTKDRLLHKLQLHFKDFIYLYDGYYRSMEEKLQAHKPKCSFSDIADNEGKITEAAMDTAISLTRVQGAQYYLKEYLAAAKDADGSIDTNVGDCVRKIIDSLGDWHGNSVFRYAIYRDENKNVNRKLVDAVNNAPYGKISYTINHFGLKTKEQVFDEYSKENLYLPENFYKLLQSLNINKLIYSNEAIILDKEIGDYGKLLFMLPDIPRTEENKESYDKIIRFISSIKDYEFDFNQKDKNGISFMEKVINSENSALVDMIINLDKKDLVYYPELDWAVSGIKNPEFKNKLKELNFKFDALEKAAELRSTLALRKLTKQLDSPLCDKEQMILHIWDIAKMKSGGMDSKKEFGRYLCNTFIDDISEETMFKIMNESI